MRGEKEQLNQVYQQENSMRQELEGVCEEKTQAIEEAKQ
jgi:chromosome segregation ATPase